MLPMQELLERVRAAAAPAALCGKVADYIPALASADPAALGIAVVDAEGNEYAAGDARRRFSIQSISKVLALAYVMTERGEEAVFSRVGKEPTGDPFNSIIRLETSAGRKPFNPLINAGAIVVSGLMPGSSPLDKGERFRAFVGSLLGRGDVARDDAVYGSEKSTAARNRSIAWFLKELGLLPGDVEDTLDVYFRQCAVSVDAVDLARIGAILCLDGVDPVRRGRVLAARTARVCKSLMVTCGMYDGSGEFAVDVGIPAKSGVGGGIMATVRDRFGLGVYGPALDERGNSAAGLAALARLSDELDLRVL
ncbi:MAG: glutaminase A [Spirochaetae bacterium HGW-Spirochaetae-3]|jgi:glutaminase|nr:MAG: glutaminase A [Spirochaetae bacterium HGW-Spirochaetae-3]